MFLYHLDLKYLELKQILFFGPGGPRFLEEIGRGIIYTDDDDDDDDE